MQRPLRGAKAAGGDTMTEVNRRTLLMAGLGLALGQTDAASSRPKVGDLFVRAGDTTNARLNTTGRRARSTSTMP